jgi:eukaryotic-like serine/threonine-protein kinase
MFEPPAQAFRGTDRFQIISQLGSGGMGVVYEVLDRERRARVALKTLRFWGPDSLLRFKQEFRALQGIRHPNLIKLGELIEEHGTWFFTMELVEGIDFKRWVRRAPRSEGHDDETLKELATLRLPKGFEELHGTDDSPSTERSVKPDATYDEERLRSAFGQLAQGLAALHQAGKVHRDVKPSNIRVRSDGHVVLLDFGLVKESLGAESRTGEVAGTAMYMAPEQALSGPIGPAADWYSAGVILYECLTGKLPFQGAPLDVLVKKQREIPESPKKLLPSIPSDLDQLCMSLLEINPARRATGREILAVVAPGESSSSRLKTSSVLHAPFVGRAKDLASLVDAFELVQIGKSVTVLIEGESGVGKSALVRHFIDDAVDHRGAIAFLGRCYEHESVPYKALDGVVDALTRFMRRLSIQEAAQLLPHRASLLAQAFPVLSRVEVIAQAPARKGEPLDPQELRTRVFGAMRELLARIAERYRLVIAIDDLQWTDADSLALLSEILRPPEAPPLLLIATMRPRDDQHADVHRALSGDVRRIALGNLSEDEARELAEKLLEDREDAGASAGAIAAEAGGHPLFIDELVRYIATYGVQETPVRLDEVLKRRVAELPAEPRQILELVTVAGAPVAQEVILRSWGPERRFEFHDHVQHLKLDRLVRTAGAQSADAIEPYHDRVRNAVLALMNDDAKQGAHARLALALEASLVQDPEAIALHWRAAGEIEKSFRWAEAAAKRAADSLAFERAARLYRLAIELGVASETHARAIKIRCAEALSHAGLGAEAGPLYIDASKGANAAEALELRRLAADQFLRCGLVDEGIHVLKDVLSQVKLTFPATPLRAVARFLFDRLRLRIGRYRFKKRDESELAPAQLARIDICWSVGFTYPSVDPIRGACFQAQQLLLALEAGEPFRVARGLALEAIGAAMLGPKGAVGAEKLLAKSDELSAPLGRPEASGLIAWSRGFCALLEARFKDGLEQCDRSVETLRNIGAMPWEIGNAHLGAVLCLTFMGRISELLVRLPLLIKMSQDRGNRYLAAQLRTGQPVIAWLAMDQPETARWHATESMREWSRAGFHIQHANDISAHTFIDLYVSDTAAAVRRVEDQWKAIERSFMLRLYLIRVVMFELRGRVFLAHAAKVSDASERRRLVALALKDARRLEREETLFGRGFARSIRAGAAAVQGDRERAVAILESAIKDFEAEHSLLRAACSKRALGALRGGSEGERLVKEADDWMKSEGIVDPARLATIFNCGFSR